MPIKSIRNLMLPAALAVFPAGTALSDAPRVATDILPVHSLVAQVMKGVGSPAFVIPPGASPHGYAMRPSEARALDEAGVVFWIGADLTPWLETAMDTLAVDARSVELLHAKGTILHEFRDEAVFDDHNHDHDHGNEHEETHGDTHEDGDQHDPHAWLDPENAKTWLNVIASELSAADPENAETYRRNAVSGREAIDAAVAEAEALLAPFRGTPYVVFHDAYQYFETRFDLSAVGSVAPSDATAPGPARIAEIRNRIAEIGAECAFAEPQFNPGIIDSVFGQNTAKVALIDPLGTELMPGPSLYPELLRRMAQTMAGCR